jgi:hypothetical protein
MSMALVLIVGLLGQQLLHGMKGMMSGDQKKGKDKHVTFSQMDRKNGSTKSLHDVIADEVEKTYASFKRRDSMGPDPDEFAHVDVSNAEAVEAAKDQAKRDLEDVVQSVDRVKDSLGNRVIAAWLQVRLLDKDKEKWLHLLQKESLWGLSRDNIAAVKEVIKKLDRHQDIKLYYMVWCELYKQAYSRISFDQRIFPGSGNLHQVLWDPERLQKRVPLLAMAYGCRPKKEAKTAIQAYEQQQQEKNRMISFLRKYEKKESSRT